MSLVIELPPELESDLAAEAALFHLPLSEYALRLLAGGRLPGPAPRNGAELVAYWQGAGLVGTRPDIADAPEHARCVRRRSSGGGPRMVARDTVSEFLRRRSS
jgi:hypothetical protein